MKEPKRQILHILNWHYVTFPEFEADHGTWLVAASETDGKPFAFPPQGTLFTFVDGEIRVGPKKEEGKVGYTFKTDPKKNPKEIDLVQKVQSREHEKIKVVLRGIYREENGRLYLCVGIAGVGADNLATGERPTEFKAGPKAHLVIFDLVKDK